MSGSRPGGRGSAYSESKFTNWSRFDPFGLEIRGLRAGRPAEALDIGERKIPIYVAPLHTEFVRPVEAREIRVLLARVPAEFLVGLDGVTQLGGTTKQARTHDVVFGRYIPGWIYLMAFKKICLSEYWRSKPRPDVAASYETAGASWSRDGAGWRLDFDAPSLRRFFLYDVLLHELGHHVDERVWTRTNRSAERYAEWFAAEQARILLESRS